MQINTSVSQSELDQLLLDLPGFYTILAKQQAPEVSFIVFENFYVSTNFFSVCSNIYFLSQYQTSNQNLLDQTIQISIFNKSDLDQVSQEVFQQNYQVHIFQIISNKLVLQQQLSPVQSEQSIAGIYIKQDNELIKSNIFAIVNKQIIALQINDDMKLNQTTGFLTQFDLKQVIFKSSGMNFTSVFDQIDVFYREVKGIETLLIDDIKQILTTIYLDELNDVSCIIGEVLKELDVDYTNLNLQNYELQTANIDQFLQIQNQDVKQIDLESVKQLYIKKCNTDSGKMITKQCFNQILTESDAILARQHAYLTISQQNPKSLLKKVMNLYRSYTNIVLKQTSSFLRENLVLRTYLQQTSEIQYYIQSVIQSNFIPEFSTFITDETQSNLQQLSAIINEFVMPNDQIFDLIENFQEVFINPNVSEDLVQVFLELQNTYAEMTQHLNIFIKEIATINSHFRFTVFNRQIAITTRVLAYLDEIQQLGNDNNFTVQILQQRAKIGIKFTTSTLQSLSERFFSALNNYKTLSQPIIQNLIKKQAPFYASLLAFTKSVGFLDFFNSASQIGQQFSFTLPTLSDNFYLTEDLFNPSLFISNPQTVKNSFSLTTPLNFITGPNSGGKSTLLKSIAISVILFQIGISTPSSLLKLKPVKAMKTIFANSDDINKKLSTFASEINDLRAAMSFCGENSLILIDEFGRGSSLQDGFGISVSSLEEMIGRSGKLICISHLKEVWGREFQSCEKWKMGVFEDGGMSYKISQGEQESLGLKTAQGCGFSTEVMENANKFYELGGLRDEKVDEVDVRGFEIDEMEEMLVGFVLGKVSADEIKGYLGRG